jgi:hypothetical protein
MFISNNHLTLLHLPSTQYANSPGLDFSSIEDQKPLESLRLVPQRSTVEYALKASKFNSVRSVQLFFPRNLSGGVDEETVRVGFIGFKGDWIEVSFERMSLPSPLYP